MSEFLRLLAGTVIHRSYVYAFLLCFLVFSVRHMRLRSTLVYIALAFMIAFLSEFSSTRTGFPFGLYTYVDETRTRELWISNVPFWDPLSFVFLSYFSWILAASLLSPASPSLALMKAQTMYLSGLLMMLLDIVIDPVTLQGEHWFLGRVYYYPHGGIYFGVTLANFLGWFFVGCAIVFAFQKISRALFAMDRGGSPRDWRPLTRVGTWICLGIYAGVFAFNLAIAAWIRRWDIFSSGLIVTALTLGPAAYLIGRRGKPSWMKAAPS